jgi:hypothetical protein
MANKGLVLTAVYDDVKREVVDHDEQLQESEMIGIYEAADCARGCDDMVVSPE